MQPQDVGNIIKALAPAFAAGVAVQQLLEILDPIVVLIFKAPNKKLVLGIISFVIGVFLAWSFSAFRIVQILLNDEPNWVIDVLVSGLILSAGTEGFNSIIKFLGYAKENKKGDAAASKGGAAGAIEKVSKNDAGAN
jgi:uncharacterized membrane protein